MLEELATAAGLEPETAFDVTWAYDFADEDALGRGMMAAGGASVLVGPEGEPGMRRQIVDAFADAAHRGRPIPPRERVPNPDCPRLTR